MSDSGVLAANTASVAEPPRFIFVIASTAPCDRSNGFWYKDLFIIDSYWMNVFTFYWVAANAIKFTR